MAGEILVSSVHGVTVYCLVFNRNGQVWNTSTSLFESYLTANYANYIVALVELGTASHLYLGNFPSAIPPGTYGVSARQQAGGSAAETDPTTGVQNYEWSGTATLPLADLATSGQLAQISPIRMAYGTMVSNFPIYLRSSADHSTLFTSGIVSGQIARDGGSYGPLQSGAFVEGGNGSYLVTLTSGDLAGATIRLLFTANGISGGASDPLPMTVITQRTSGH